MLFRLDRKFSNFPLGKFCSWNLLIAAQNMKPIVIMLGDLLWHGSFFLSFKISSLLLIYCLWFDSITLISLLSGFIGFVFSEISDDVHSDLMVMFE